MKLSHKKQLKAYADKYPPEDREFVFVIIKRLYDSANERYRKKLIRSLRREAHKKESRRLRAEDERRTSLVGVLSELADDGDRI